MIYVSKQLKFVEAIQLTKETHAKCLDFITWEKRDRINSVCEPEILILSPNSSSWITVFCGNWIIKNADGTYVKMMDCEFRDYYVEASENIMKNIEAKKEKVETIVNIVNDVTKFLEMIKSSIPQSVYEDLFMCPGEIIMDLQTIKMLSQSLLKDSLQYSGGK